VIHVDDLTARSDAIDTAWRILGGSAFSLPAVHRRDQEPRHYLTTTDRRYDLIDVSLLGSHGAASAGAASLDPDFFLTLETQGLLQSRLKPGGLAAYTTWVDHPPRGGVRLSSLLIR
jgi:hypothetical protein